MVEKSWRPRIVAFLCRWCGYAGADLAGVSRMKYPEIYPIRVNCSGSVHPELILDAFRKGADGVLICGCHTPNDCHYISGNYKALKRVALVKKLLSQLGISQERVRLEWISAAEGRKFSRVVKEFYEKIRELGPLEVRV
ncbi:methyl-viologen-reducing hydrogenase subunit delta [Candidatus Bathyarchaeota archaeon ex4484_205]|nr:MAG: methyl-viologen-reducing hydrogenase subunit delta [Candidatus Bathyarchaeota archaeon ex4484_205]